MKLIKNKGFTLIELLVTIAVLSILILLGVPRFLGYTQKAELSRIQHDVKVMEQEIGTVLINNDDEFNKWENNSEDFNQLIQSNNLFEKEGVAKKIEDLSIDKTYKVIPEKYKDKINTKLKGTFYANSGGEVYYEHVNPGIEGLIEKGYIPIATAEELNSIRSISPSPRTYGEGSKWEDKYTGGLDKKYIQVANIDLSEYSEEGWAPIGTFTGTYDGGNYVIEGLEIEGEGKNYQGLFGRTERAIIRNVGLVGNKVTGAGDYIGGLVGLAHHSTIENSYATGSTKGKDRVGGLVGHAQTGTNITNSYATGSVEGTGVYSTGGLVGYAGSDTTISKSYATGEVTGTGNNVGGLVGRINYSSNISNSYATGSVTGGSSVGGLVGFASYSTKTSNSYATGEVTGKGNVGGLVGSIHTSSTIENSYWDTETTRRDTSAGGVGATGMTTEKMKLKGTYEGWNFETIWKIDNGKDYPKLR